jgi:hypothetical protein
LGGASGYSVAVQARSGWRPKAMAGCRDVSAGRLLLADTGKPAWFVRGGSILTCDSSCSGSVGFPEPRFESGLPAHFHARQRPELRSGAASRRAVLRNVDLRRARPDQGTCTCLRRASCPGYGPPLYAMPHAATRANPLLAGAAVASPSLPHLGLRWAISYTDGWWPVSGEAGAGRAENSIPWKRCAAANC